MSRVDAPVMRRLLALAWPVLGALFLKLSFNLVDIWWVGHLGAAAVAALSTSTFLYWLLLSLGEGLLAGTLALVARATGEGDREAADRASAQGIVWSFLAGLAASVMTWLLAPAAFRLMAVPAEVAVSGIDYMRGLAPGLPFLFTFIATDAVFRGLGRTRISLGLWGSALALNAVLDPFLILGVGSWPGLGVRGAGLATALSFAAGAALGTSLVARALASSSLRSAFRRPRLDLALAILRIGLPISLNGVLFSLVYVGLTTLTSRFGTAALAGLGVGQKIESPSYLVACALSSATATLVGQALGRADVEDARRTAWSAAGLAAGTGLLAAGVLLLWPAPLARLFLPDPAVVAAAVMYLRVMAVAQIFQGLEVALEGAFAGAGRTLPYAAWTIPLTLARLPLAWLLVEPCGLGLAGVFWALTASSTAKGIAVALQFHRGRWVQPARRQQRA